LVKLVSMVEKCDWMVINHDTIGAGI